MKSAHPVAELFPLLNGAEFDALVADIREHGLREPITLHPDGSILDGRNRWRACKEAGVEPRTVEWDGAGTVEQFVISKNLHRRHLDESDRSMVAAKLANMKREDTLRQNTTDGQICPSAISIKEAASMMKVGTSTVKDAKTVLRDGTPDEIAAIQAGTAAVTTTAKKIRARKKSRPVTASATVNTSSSTRVKCPDGMSMEDVARAGLLLESEGAKAEAVAKRFHMAVSTYRHMRDIVLLAERPDLKPADRERVGAALRDMNETNLITAPYATVADLVERVFGRIGRRGVSRDRAHTKRLELFDHGLGHVVHTCSLADDIEIPYLSAERAKKAVGEVRRAETQLRVFRQRIEEQASV